MSEEAERSAGIPAGSVQFGSTVFSAGRTTTGFSPRMGPRRGKMGGPGKALPHKLVAARES
eukprot:11637662-Heterocapsa_arctica.AAC.1